MRPARSLFVGFLLGAAAAAHAERLPIQAFTAADGLAHDRVKCFMRDSRGLLWLCSAGGIDWFDGQRFTGHTLDERLAFSANDVLEAPDHTYWISTNGRGVVHFDPAGEHIAVWPPNRAEGSNAPRLRAYPVGDTVASNRVNTLFRDRAGVLWAGTDDGLYRFDGDNRFRVEPIARGTPRRLAVTSFAETADGSLWIGTSQGLFRRRPGGATSRQNVRSVSGMVWALLAGEDDDLWIGHDTGASRASLNGPTPSDTLEATALQAVAPGRVLALFRAPSGVVWIGYDRGPLVRYDGRQFEVYTTEQGIPTNGANAIGQDAEGNLWVSDMTTGGAARILRNGFRTYGRGDGLRSDVITQLIETAQHDVCGLAGLDREPKLDCFDGRRFQAVRPALPDAASGWQGRHRTLRARDGSWWFATTQGLYRFAPVERVQDLARARPAAVYTTANGLPANGARGLFEDARGDVWMWFETPDGCAVSRWLHDSGAVVPVNGIPRTKQLNEVGEDADGDVWLGFYDGDLARWRNGTVRMFGPDEGVTAPLIASIGRDHADRLWISVGADLGLLTVDAPSSDHPRFVPFATSNGLAAPRSVGSFVEDNWGNMYIASGYGIDRLDAARSWFTHFDKADGLPDMQVWSALKDSSGTLWFGTMNGIARLVPEQLDPPQPPLVRIHSFRIGGVRYPLSFLGEPDVPNVSIPLGYSPIEIDYASLAGNVQYQYRLEGSDVAWRTVRIPSITFANLSAGSYRFAVRAVRRGGLVIGPPATVAFTIVPPFWRRWWFFSVALGALAALAYGVHRYRVARLVEVERIRTRIASDLHDDIGSSLSQIAILSEVASRREASVAPDVREALGAIGRTAGELIDSMSDIVWAINPKHDALADLAGRMRRFASDLLAARDIAFHFDAPERDGAVHLSPEIRRELYLTFKESLRNIVRHSRCTEVSATFRVHAGWLELKLRDNGIGFDVGKPAAGHGLSNFRARAAALAGVLDIQSAPGRGTSISLRLPLNGPARKFPYLHGW